jgi:hypothetical protein
MMASEASFASPGASHGDASRNASRDVTPLRAVTRTRGYLWARLDVALSQHPRWMDAKLSSRGFWTSALCWLRRYESETGIVPLRHLAIIGACTEKEARDACEDLVTAGLFAFHPDVGFELLHYADKNETGSQVDARRSAGAERQRRYREKHPVPTAASRNALRDVTVMGESQSQSQSQKEEREREQPSRDPGRGPQREAERPTALTAVTVTVGSSTPEPHPLLSRGRFGVEVALWAGGVRKALGSFLGPRGDKAEAHVAEVADTYGPTEPGPARNAWLEQAGERFGRMSDPLKFKRSVWGWGDWLNQGSPDKNAPLPSRFGAKDEGREGPLRRIVERGPDLPAHLLAEGEAHIRRLEEAQAQRTATATATRPAFAPEPTSETKLLPCLPGLAGTVPGPLSAEEREKKKQESIEQARELEAKWAREEMREAVAG